MKRVKEILPHDLMYDEVYYREQVDGPAVIAAGVIAESIVSRFRPAKVIDIGCGTGAILSAFRDLGCEVTGLEYSEAALTFCRARNLDVKKFDIEKDVLEDAPQYDVTISTEVAEHLPERMADRFVNLVSSFSPTIVFTAAFPGQGGADHVNEQPQSYWIEKFQRRGFELDVELSETWKLNWKAAGIAFWYWNNVMVFRRRAA